MNWETLKRCWRIEVMGGEHKPLTLRHLLRRLRKREQQHYLFWLRLAQYFHQRPRGWLNYPKLARRIQARLIREHRIEIMLGAEIGPGLVIAHPVGIVIGDVARIGENLRIRQNTTIGALAHHQQGYVHVGDNVDLGANVCIVGDGLRIGNNVTIGAMAFINKDVPDNSVAYSRHVQTVTAPRV